MEASELYLDAVVNGEKETATFIREKYNLANYDLFKLAVQRNIKLSDLNMAWTQKEQIAYYTVVLEKDCLELYLQQEEGLTSLLGKKDVRQVLFKSTSARIIHHLCKQGEYKPIIIEYLIRSMRSEEGLPEKEYQLLASICAQYASVKFLTTRFITQASARNPHLCKLLLRLGARPSEEQKQMLFRQSAAFHKALFGEDV